MVQDLLGRHLLTLLDYTPSEILSLLQLAAQLKAEKAAGHFTERLRHKNIALLFEKTSTRTRCAFEVAAYDEGARVTFLSNSQMGKKESIEDTAKVLGRYYDGIEFRGFEQTTVERLAQHAGVPVWNGLTDLYHPTQILADFLTIQEHLDKPLDQIKLVYVGDLRNNVAHSLMIGAAKLGMQYVGLGPKALFASSEVLANVHDVCPQANIKLTEDHDTALQNADVIYTDVWVSMGEENQFETRIKQLKPYQVTLDMLKCTGNADTLFMHCLPANHDMQTEVGKMVAITYGLNEMEVTDKAFRSAHSVVFDQAENRMHTIKAVMVATLGDSDKLTC